MIRAITISSVWLLLAAMYFLFVSGPFTIVFLVTTIMFISYLASSVIVVSRHLNCHIEQPSHVTKNEHATYKLYFQNNSKLSAVKVSVKLSITHTFTSQKKYEKIEIFSLTKKQTHAWQITHAYSGQYEVAIVEIELSDAIGLFKKTVTLNEACHVLVMPTILQKSNRQLLQSVWQNGLANVTSTIHSSGEELVQMKPYTPGDPVKRIHWKLSSKLDELYVQQLAPLAKEELVVTLDFTGFTNELSQYDRVMELMAAWLMYSQTNHYVKLALWDADWKLQVVVTEQDVVTCLKTLMQKSQLQLTSASPQLERLRTHYADAYVITTSQAQPSNRTIIVQREMGESVA